LQRVVRLQRVDRSARPDDPLRSPHRVTAWVPRLAKRISDSKAEWVLTLQQSRDNGARRAHSRVPPQNPDDDGRDGKAEDHEHPEPHSASVTPSVAQRNDMSTRHINGFGVSFPAQFDLERGSRLSPLNQPARGRSVLTGESPRVLRSGAVTGERRGDGQVDRDHGGVGMGSPPRRIGFGLEECVDD
jgi:hypothetical protein